MSQSEKEREIAQKTYLDLQETLNLKKGDVVKVIFEVPDRALGWNNHWTLNMDKFVDNHYKVEVESSNTRGVRLSCKGHTFYFPIFCLEVVSRKADEQAEIEALTKRLEDVFNAGHDGIRYVGSANSQSREEEAIKKLNDAMNPEK